jgi:hypothetical protein
MGVTEWTAIGVGLLLVSSVMGVFYLLDAAKKKHTEIEDVLNSERKFFIRLGRCYYQVSRMKKFLFESGDIEGREKVARSVRTKEFNGGYVKAVYRGIRYYLKREI